MVEVIEDIKVGYCTRNSGCNFIVKERLEEELNSSSKFCLHVAKMNGQFQNWLKNILNHCKQVEKISMLSGNQTSTYFAT